MSVVVIVSQCTPDGSTFGDRLVDVRFPTLIQAAILGEGERVQGRSVVIRPEYNEEDREHRFFREWRSFNGEPFKEVRWNYGRVA